jgi:N-acetylmuramoyl-L-alanine amidase
MIQWMHKSVITLLFLLAVISVQAIEPEINVVWPRKDEGIGAVDSSFILGSVTPGSKLEINGESVAVHPDGGFIAFLPISPGDFTFNILAENDGDINYMDWTVSVPEPIRSFDYKLPRLMDHTDILYTRVLADGDRLVVECRGTPDCIVTFTIPGYADSVPMVELPPQIQPYWGEAVFGSGSVPDSA